jgi:Zn-dependent protease with chaperone function
MQNRNFEQLILRLEKSAKDNPGNYLLTVLGVALLGFAILGLAIGLTLLSVGLLVGLVALVVFSGGKALVLVAKLGKLVILLAIPAWTMVRSTFTLLFSRFPKPVGRQLLPEEAPLLFERLNAMRTMMKGPRVHKVLLSDELNASIVQHPRFGLFGWEENYLILGLPLLQTLSEEETIAVVAHEYGHLSGHHSRFGGFIYRFRLAWGRLQELSESWNDWGSRMIAKLIKWYAPYFNAYTFVLARQNEYIADQASVEIAGRQHAANALMRIDIAARFESEKFWPAINRRVASEAEPCLNRSTLWEQSLAGVDVDLRTRLLEEAGKLETDHLDTHPALADRLAAIGAEMDSVAASKLEVPVRSAASAWLGSNLESIKQEFDKDWQENVAENWRSRHAYLQERQQRLATLAAQQTFTTEEQWEHIGIVDELKPDEDLMPLLNALLEQKPEHASALFRRGSLLLERGNEAGIVDLEKVMQLDADAILSGCEVAWRFYKTRDAEKTEQYAQRWQQRSDYLNMINTELDSLPANADLAPADLDEEAVASVRKILQENGQYIRRAYLMRRILKSDSSVHDYVLAFETQRFTFGDKSKKVIEQLVQQEFPVKMYIVHLGSDPYTRFRKSIKKMKLPPLEFN